MKNTAGIRKKVSIYKIASIAGVSASTVSRALNGNERVSYGTREKIIEISRMLQGGQSIPELLLPSAMEGTPKRLCFYTESWGTDVLFEGMQDTLRNTDHELFFISNKRGEYSCDTLLDNRIDGLIFLGYPRKLLERYPDLKGIPAVQVMGNEALPGNTLTNVTYHADRVAQLMISHLADCTSPIYYFNARHNIGENCYRRANLLEYYAGQKNLEFIPFVYDDDKCGKDVEDFLERLKRGRSGLFGICCYDDEIVEYIKIWLERGNFKAETDYKIIGCNNNARMLDKFNPRPATIDLKFAEIGRIAVTHLLRKIQYRLDEHYTLLIEPVLVASRAGTPSNEGFVEK